MLLVQVLLLSRLVGISSRLPWVSTQDQSLTALRTVRSIRSCSSSLSMDKLPVSSTRLGLSPLTLKFHWPRSPSLLLQQLATTVRLLSLTSGTLAASIRQGMFRKLVLLVRQLQLLFHPILRTG